MEHMKHNNSLNLIINLKNPWEKIKLKQFRGDFNKNPRQKGEKKRILFTT